MTKNRGMGIIHALAMVLFCMVMSIGMVCFAGEKGTVKVKSAKIRASADTSSDHLGSVSQGGTVDIIGETTGADGKIWYQVYVDENTTGYIRSDLVNKTGEATNTATPSTDAPVSVEGRTGTIKSESGASIRASASADSEKLGTANKGTAVVVTGETDGSDGMKWYQVSVTYNGSQKTGYIRSDLLTLDEPAESSITGAENAEGNTQDPEQAESTPDDSQQPEQAEQQNTTKQNMIPMNVEEVPYILPGFEKFGLTVNDQTVNAYKNGNFYLFYAQEQSGEAGWYIFDSEKGVYQRYVYTADNATIPKEDSGAVGLLPVIILVIIIVILAAVVGLLIIKLKEHSDDDRYMGREEEEDDSDEIEDIDDFEAIEQEMPPVRRPQPTRPSNAQPQRRPQPQQPVRRPQPQQSSGQNPARRSNQDGQPQPPVRRPQPRSGEEPNNVRQNAQPPRRSQSQTGEIPGGARPAGRPQGARPAGSQGQNGQNPVRRQAQNTQQPVRRPQPQNEPAQSQRGYKAKNMLEKEDDDMDFMDL